MKEYKKVITFRYKGTLYNLYLDKNYRRFFLKVNDDGTLSYISLDKMLELSRIYTGDPNINLAEYDAKRIKFIPKVISGGITVILTSTLLSGCGLAGKNAQSNISTNDNEEISQEYNQENNNFNQNTSENNNSNQNNLDDDYDYSYILDYSMQDRNRAANDLLCHFENPSDGSITIYDKKDLDPRTSDIKNISEILPIKQNITYDDFLEVIDENQSIPEKFKPLLQDYCLSFCQNYPHASKDVLYENLKTIKIKEVNDQEMKQVSKEPNSAGLYVTDKNTIYFKNGQFNEEKDYNKGTYSYQLFCHEVSHAAVEGSFADGKVRVGFMGRLGTNVLCKEALNTLFTLSIMNCDIDDGNTYTYPQVTNYYRVMLECMDDYSLEDYINHNSDYFLNKLNKAAGNDYAPEVMDIISTQYKANVDDDMEASKEGYRAIYDYISELYYGKFITSDMTYQEAKSVADDLVTKLNNNIGTSAQIDSSRFYKNLDRYCDKIGIQKNVKTR